MDQTQITVSETRHLLDPNWVRERVARKRMEDRQKYGRTYTLNKDGTVEFHSDRPKNTFNIIG